MRPSRQCRLAGLKAAVRWQARFCAFEPGGIATIVTPLPGSLRIARQDGFRPSIRSQPAPMGDGEGARAMDVGDTARPVPVNTPRRIPILDLVKYFFRLG